MVIHKWRNSIRKCYQSFSFVNQIAATPSPPPNTRPLRQRSVAISVGLRVECRRAEGWRRDVLYQTRKLNRCVDNGKCADGGPRVVAYLLRHCWLHSEDSVNISPGNALLSGFLIQSPTLSILLSLFLNFLPLSSKLSSVHFLLRDCFMAQSKQTANWASSPLDNFFFLLHHLIALLFTSFALLRPNSLFPLFVLSLTPNI